MSETRLVKACACYPMTASGPRVVFGQEMRVGDAVHAQLIYVPMACDVCDAPWVEPGAAKEAGEGR